MLKTPQAALNQLCLNCQFVLHSETSDTGLRCGQSYFYLPPIKRKPVPMNTYPVVQEKHFCLHWTTAANQILSRPTYSRIQIHEQRT